MLRIFSIYDRLFSEAGLDKSDQSIDCFLFIGAAGHDLDVGAAHDAKGQNAEKGLGVDASLVFLDPDAGLELISLLDEERCRTGMKATLILNFYAFDIHSKFPHKTFRKVVLQIS